MNPMVRALGVVIATNTQVAGLVMVAFWLESYLKKNYPQDFSWQVVVIPLALLGCLQAYYVMFRYLFKLDKELRRKK